MDTNNAAVLGQLHRVINLILFLKKKDVFQYQGVTLHPSEIHLLLAVARGRKTNATAIAKGLGVTKGAVSQTLTRLEKKGVLRKTRDPANKNELTLDLTALGTELLRHYQALAARLDRRLAKTLEPYTPEEKLAIQRFLAEVAEVFQAWR